MLQKSIIQCQVFDFDTHDHLRKLAALKSAFDDINLKNRFCSNIVVFVYLGYSTNAASRDVHMV